MSKSHRRFSLVTFVAILGIVVSGSVVGASVVASAAQTAGCAPFRQPYSGDAAYEKGDKVTFNGKAYVSTFAPNWWSPTAAPQYWSTTSCDTGTPTATPTPTATATPTPTPTPTATPTPTPTPTPGGGTPPTTGTPSGLVFSPYKDIAQAMFWGAGAGYTMGTSAVDGTRTPLVGTGTTLKSTLPQLNAITLAFATGECGQENWAGVSGPDFAASNIPGLDAAGYDYILGTGGAAGSFTCSSTAGMETFIERYASDNLIGVDFDIERGQSAADIRNQVDAAVAVQDRYPNLRFSFTVATLGASDGSFGGVNETGDTVISTVLGSSLRNYTINLMVMDYGDASSSVCVMAGAICDMGASAIQAVANLRHSYPAVPLTKIELTPMIALNDIADEIFTLQDIDEMTAYALRNDLAGLHYWSLDRDVPCGSTALSNICNSTPSVPALGYTKRFLTALGRL